MIRASCCCGDIRFELAASPSMLGTCHCTRCRKVGASAFVFVLRADIRWLSGRDRIATYVPDPPYRYARSFCRRCGTALGEILSDQERVPIPANLLDDEPGLANRFHEFVAEKPEWLVIGDEARQFPGHPPH